MKREFLKNLGLDDELINKILDENTNDIGKAIKKGEESGEKANLTVEQLNEELKKANDTIKSLQKSNQENESLQTLISEYKSEISTLKEQHAKDQISHYTTLKLKDNGAINTQAVLPFIDLNKGSINQDGSITGIDEQIDSVINNEELAFLFKSKEEVIPKTQIEQPIRGGYEPVNGGGDTEKSLGQIMAETISTERRQVADTSSFWNSL